MERTRRQSQVKFARMSDGLHIEGKGEAVDKVEVHLKAEKGGG